MGNEDQALNVHSKKSRRENDHHQGKHSHQKDNSIRSSKDLSEIRFYTCDEEGHFTRDCPRNRGGYHKKKNNKRRHHAHTAEDVEPPRKRVKESEDSSSDEEYVLISTLTGTVTHGRNDWIIYSGDSLQQIELYI